MTTPPLCNDETRIDSIGRRLLDRARAHQAGRLTATFWTDKLMGWALSDHAFKVQLFRFVDVFPMLQTPEAIHRHLMEYLSQPGVRMPRGMKTALAAGGFLKKAMAATVTSRVRSMAETFIAGEYPYEAVPKLKRRWEQGIAFSVDVLGEACLSEKEADVYRAQYLKIIDLLSAEVARWPQQPLLSSDHLGPVPRANVSIKITAMTAKVDPSDYEGSIRRTMAGIAPILEAASKRGVFINFDMEHHQLKDLTIELLKRCAEKYDTPMGLAMQAYLRSGDDDARSVIDWAKRVGRRVSVRLVKGAYWDHEVIDAERRGWPVPVWMSKPQTDACFERMAAQFIAATPRSAGEGGVTLALGSHNLRSIAAAMTLLEKHNLPTNALELQMLYGMGEPLKRMAVEEGLRLREYVPIGAMIPGMAYLVRRLLENTSNESWLRHGFLDGVSADELLANPDTAPTPTDSILPDQRTRHMLSPAIPGVGDSKPFINEPTRDFSEPAQRQAFAKSICRLSVPKHERDATLEEADTAVAVAHEAQRQWRQLDPIERANLLTRTAELMRKRRDELAGVVIKESSKPWAESDADVCEAIDFCEYYAREAVGLFKPRRLGKFMGELDEVFYQPRGVAVVISPWNFPLAICTGMTAAALVTGNTVIVKPAEQTPGIAYLMCQLMWEAGVPEGVLQFLPGQGEVIGAALVRDPRVALIAFTGSKAVGLDIVKAAGVTPEGQTHVKKVIAEMGGKNAIIVDSSADLDEAVVGVMHSAFGYSGQKCSACSRVIVLDEVHDTFVGRLVEASRALKVGDPLDPASDMAPVIDDEAAAKIRRYIEIGKTEGKMVLGDDPPREGRLIGPHIFTGITTEHRLAQEEVFGPVLAVMRVPHFDDALLVANQSPYKLTGGIFSRTPSHLHLARAEFRVGNLYINRGCTGALVGRQPFGGFGLSGVGSKAGGGDYLLQFVEPRAVTENTLRRGFSPELED